MQRINLVIFNENYWTGGLIYSQNIKPLLQIKRENPEVSLRLISFTSILMWILKYKEIKKFEIMVREEGFGKVVNLPVLFVPSRIFILRWFMIPFLIINCLPYMLCMNIADFLSKKKQVYNLRSYGTSLIFLLLYYNKKCLFFDTRTDYITEQINQSIWRSNSISNRLWLWAECKILKKFNKTFFISEPQQAETLERHSIVFDERKYIVIYNPVDISGYTKSSMQRNNTFVYSGSLGNWNNIQLYLDFFLQIKDEIPDSQLIIMTPTPHAKLKQVIEDSKYDKIRNSFDIIYNANHNVLDKFYTRSKWGLQLMSKKDSRVGVKVVEYIASGLIPIVSENVEGAASLVSKYKVGIVYNGNLNIEQLKNFAIDSVKREEFLNLISLDKYSQNLYSLYDEV